MIFIRNNLFALLISLLFWTCTFIPFDASAERLVQNKNQYHANLWDRIRSGFALALPPDSKAIRKIEALYAQNPEAFNRIVASSERYLYYIVDEIELGIVGVVGGGVAGAGAERSVGGEALQTVRQVQNEVQTNVTCNLVCH